MRIFCLSSEPDIITMWSHYADKHQGFCIGFNFEGSELESCLHKVDYTFENPYAEIFRIESIMEKQPNEFIRRLKRAGILNKFIDWQYEKEYRLIIENGEKKQPIEPSMIREIIFGIKMNPIHKQIIRDVLSGKEWKHINFKQTEQYGNHLKLKIRPTLDSDYVS